LAENLKQKNIEIKRIGIYVIILLALIRFLIYPLHASIQEKKVLLGEWNENYRIKSQVFERQRGSQGMKIVVEKSALFNHLFDKGVSNSYVQSDVLEWIIKIAEKKGLTVLNFEMLEPILGKGVSEVPILVRLKGMPGSFIEILEAIEKGERTLSIRSMEITKSGQDQVFSLTISAFRVEI
jgi:Tfp pilus assembly protein PilO